MTTPARTVNGRVIGLAHYAGRAVLESVLARHGATFQQLITLRPVAVADGPVGRAELVEDVVHSLKISPADVETVVEELIGRGLLTAEGSTVKITGAGRELYETTSGETGAISARIYADIPADDLAAAGRVLARVTERANAELAALSA
ncbi:MarR family transcriptional regulator [Streptomyces sp. DH24]|uniref:MarR family transcriptional regulator n=1 Tax=Streptomyces sp. DH24 TaxID=3040123 RepID=UPI002442752C|nr:MarR family transcriptional regulator [Streptomyces sp. DH24]MDG9717233.1 MarR family transcriptional regulator [Streptomyces sp. DH24]